MVNLRNIEIDQLNDHIQSNECRLTFLFLKTEAAAKNFTKIEKTEKDGFDLQRIEPTSLACRL